jgi:hypothetical protein
MVHQVKEAPEVGGQKIEVKATFISIPIFCSMKSPEPKIQSGHVPGFLQQPFNRLFEKVHRLVHDEDYDYKRDDHLHRVNKQAHLRNDHPIRSLMRYANILALDNSRDYKQAILRLGDDVDSTQPPYIHVPEFWALIINHCKSWCSIVRPYLTN